MERDEKKEDEVFAKGEEYSRKSCHSTVEIAMSLKLGDEVETASYFLSSSFLELRIVMAFLTQSVKSSGSI